jgi:NAD(P)-dependent dehydrogenase (short-subunit alcohol dehydrogenase family)
MRWVITGANRGIGAEFVRQLIARGDHVDAGARDPHAATALLDLAARHADKLRVHGCDVSDDASVRGFAQALGDVAVDVLVNNAGVMGKMQSLEALDLEDVKHTFDVNALGAVRVTRALLAHLEHAKTRRVVQITSGMGSITDNASGGAYGYRMSKAGLNMANKSMSVDLRARGFTCVVINPGWVKTDMGGAGATITAEDSVRKMLAIIDGLTPEQTGSFLNFRGGTYPY